MKKSLTFIIGIMLMLSILCINISAEEGYLLADDILQYNNQGQVTNIDSYLNNCKNRGLNAKFGNKTYTFNSSFSIPNGVSLIGADNTIFKGVSSNNYQLNIFDSNSGTKNIKIANIIFDNITIYSNKSSQSSNWTIENNIFINAKMVDISIDSGLTPDSNNQNGGENTGYYILLSKNSNSKIKSNLFLRDENSLGRGVSTYSTNNTVIEDNYFGMLSDIDNSIVSTQTKSLKTKLSADLVKSDNQGYFMTCINIVNKDTNTYILNNHISVNKDLYETQYEDKSYNSKGYHRDHLIYAKGFTNLEIVGNYFKGQTKNQDGGLKLRNGEGLFVHKNVLDDTLLLLYIQPGDSKLKNVLVSDNIFINKTPYISTRIEYSNPKYISQSFLVLIYNYVNGAELKNITIKDNEILSEGLNNEEIRLSLQSSDSIDSFSIYNNKNYLGNSLEIYDNTNKKSYEDIENSDEYTYVSSNDYSNINVENNIINKMASYTIKNKKMISNAKIYINGALYTNQILDNKTRYIVFLIEAKNDIIMIDDVNDYGKQIEYMISTNQYSYFHLNINEDISIPESVKLENVDALNVLDYINNYSNYEISFDNVENCNFVNNEIIFSESGTYNLQLTISGYIYGFTVEVDLNLSETPEVPETPETPEVPEMPETPEVPETPETDKPSHTIKISGCGGSLSGVLLAIISLSGAIIIRKRRE